ncbi:hypothetical protein BTR14_01990 [Rhizobium rhizosphaerae]|uniref:Uncharacterized protein n=2 Tax=Xaviernesmea rhizosphaerae TaxID=1672749 RepID=A0ABX3PJS0_9HYPH|nr:hypothetical protein BTR14_01990 [Xaviernesmea rhizosphaerae]
MAAVSAMMLMQPALSPARAADMTAPVREIMTEAERGWSETPSGEPRDYFDAERLKRIYSADFNRAYAAAAKFPAYEDGGSPFDYDVIVSGQDSCTLKDIHIEEKPAAGGATPVEVSFDNKHCLAEEGAPPPDQSHLTFRMIEESGRVVIDDIIRPDAAGSLKGELDEMAKLAADEAGKDGKDGN